MSDEPFEEEPDPEEAERRIIQFVTSAEELPGPPVAELAVMDGKPHNQVLATQLLLGQRADCRLMTQNSGTSTRQLRY